MDWKVKALLLHVAATPIGYPAYQVLQKHFGKHRSPHWVFNKFRELAEMLTLIRSHGTVLERAVVCEVGTGWIPLAPIGFFLCGAPCVHSFDLNSHLLESALRRALHWIVANQSRLNILLKEVVDPALLEERFVILRKHVQNPKKFFEVANIHLHAPADAAHTNLPAQSIDIHYSTNVLEHIPESTLLAILRETQRILKPNGVAVHFVDTSDHFSHSDPHIHSSHFLRFSPRVWNIVAGNRLAYHNRLRDKDYRTLFYEAGLNVIHNEFRSDKTALKALQSGFKIWNGYKEQNPEELTRVALRYVSRLQ
jgi:SAM-dependent methyltransferase